MDNNIILGSGDFILEVKNTCLMEWEGVKLHVYLTAYLDKIMDQAGLRANK